MTDFIAGESRHLAHKFRLIYADSPLSGRIQPCRSDKQNPHYGGADNTNALLMLSASPSKSRQLVKYHRIVLICDFSENQKN